MKMWVRITNIKDGDWTEFYANKYAVTLYAPD